MYSFCSRRDRSVSFTGRLVARVRRNHRARARGACYNTQCRPPVRPPARPSCPPFAETLFFAPLGSDRFSNAPCVRLLRSISRAFRPFSNHFRRQDGPDLPGKSDDCFTRFAPFNPSPAPSTVIFRRLQRRPFLGRGRTKRLVSTEPSGSCRGIVVSATYGRYTRTSGFGLGTLGRFVRRVWFGGDPVPSIWKQPRRHKPNPKRG